ncbi:MAG: DUF4179 domain-containing protein [Oscillospiraceae bacterium]|nr:DUF4179 domain-containing protein [Oscillospiraceae bacterium]
MFKEKYCAIYDQITPNPNLLANIHTEGGILNKQKAKRFRRLVALPAGSVLSLFIAFILAVNLSPAFAQELSKVPVLDDLAAAVSFSPSLSEAVLHNYVQHIDQEQTVNDITIKVDYIIVDGKQLHMFLSVQSEKYEDAAPSASGTVLLNADGSPIAGYRQRMSGLVTTDYNHEYLTDEMLQNKTWHIIFDFMDTKIPNHIILKTSVFDSQKSEMVLNEEETTAFSTTYMLDTISEFSIPIDIDSNLIQPSKEITVNHDFMIDGQMLTVSGVEIFPTHALLTITEGEENTAYLQSLSAYLADENGNRYEPHGYNDNRWYYEGNDGITKIYLESPYFTDFRNLTLAITDAVWLDKDYGLTKIDLVNNEAFNLPPNVRFIDAARLNNDWAIIFTAPNRQQVFYDPFFEQMGRHTYDLFNSREIYNETGDVFSFATGWIWDNGYKIWDDTYKFFQIPGEEGEFHSQGRWEVVDEAGIFCRAYFLKDYSHDLVFLMPAYSHMSNPAEPIEITIR